MASERASARPAGSARARRRGFPEVHSLLPLLSLTGVSFLPALILTALLLLAGSRSLARAAALPPADYSGEELSEPDSPQPNYLSLALLIQSEAATLKAELCNKYTVCDNSMEVLLQNNLDLPKITAENGCFKSGFKRDKCLQKISSGLVEFQPYLLVVENTFTTEGKLVQSLCHKTKHLAAIVKLMMKNPNAVPIADKQQTLLPKLQTDDTWMQRVSTRLILRDFTLFIEKTIRAIRFLSTKGSLHP
ncbi:interleukin-6 [Rhinatrema bivittatum]|uniref:interleukin-6 n=1 Tax=Rhinatrema bivittatum TaxID=194408 RepID=UPI00112EB3AD|nr:interleukin-6 [Rhinatrema bivittatum]